MRKNGISLIVLIVTIIVVIILAAVVILTLSKNNPIESAKEATFKEDIRAYQDELNMYIAKEYQQSAGMRDWKITATEYEKDSTKENYNNSVYKYLNSFKKKYENKLAIKDDMIAYVGFDEKEKNWLLNSGIYMSKKFTVQYINEYGEKLFPDEEIAELDTEYVFYPKEKEGYISLQPEISGTATSDTTVTFEYCKICDDLAFIGLDANGNETTVEENIVSYTVSGIGDCTNTWISIPRFYKDKEVTQIKSRALYRNNTIKKLVITSTVKKVGSNCFEGCNKLEMLGLYAKVIEGSDCFRDSGLKKVIIGKEIENIGNRPFYSCSNLEDVLIKNDQIDISSFVFWGCKKLKALKVEEDNQKYKVVDGVLYSKDEKTIYAYPPGKEGNFVIPSTVEELRREAFYYNYQLTELEIPSTVKKVGSNCFEGCNKLEMLGLYAKVIEGYDCFRDSGLKKVIIGKEIENIGNRPFYLCQLITQINYLGTDSEWNNVVNKNTVNIGNNLTKVVCSNGNVDL